MKNFVEHVFNGDTTTSYNYAKTFVGSGNFIKQYTGATISDAYISTYPLTVGRPMEASVAIACTYPWVYSWSDDIDWIFLMDNGSAAATRRYIFYEYNKSINQFNYKGFITTTGPGGNQTSRGLRAGVYTYSSGTTTVSTTAVTGTDTLWVNIGFASGARIGFGSTNPTKILTWYEISSIDSNTGITLTSTAGTIASPTEYVIEEIRLYATVTNATTTNGGLFIVKGLNYNTFTSVGTNISTATNTDNIRALYWLKDAATVTMIAAWGITKEDVNSTFTEEYCYVPAGAVAANSYFIYKYNLRASLTVSGGVSTSAYLFTTGAIGSALTGTIIQTNNGRIATLKHGVANNIPSLFFCTTTRLYRCALADITNGSTNYLSDVMVNVPPGGASTYLAPGFSSVEYSATIDRLILGGAAATRSTITQYTTNSEPHEIIFLANDNQYDQSIADSSAPVHPTTNATVMSFYSENGYLYVVRGGTTAALNQMYCLPMKVHRQYADTSGEYIITPKLNTTGALKFYKVYITITRQLGDSTFGAPTEDIDLLFRTSGIDDDSGTWVLLDYNGDLSGIEGSNEIQFKIRFKTLGTWCIPARIHSLCVTYEDDTSDSHYTPSVNLSSAPNRIFAYRQSLSWGTNIPNLKIKIYNASTSSVVLDDDVDTSAHGTWEYSTNGTVWDSWDSSADNVGNYIRYTATTLPSSIIARALLTQ